MQALIPYTEKQRISRQMDKNLKIPQATQTEHKANESKIHACFARAHGTISGIKHGSRFNVKSCKMSFILIIELIRSE